MNNSLKLNNSISEKFSINGSLLSYEVKTFPFIIESFPKKYSVSTTNNYEDYQNLLMNSDFIIIDEIVNNSYPLPKKCKAHVFVVKAIEENKNLNTVIDLINVFIEKNISKGTNVVAIGGGIIQDIVACSCALFRRGQPFTYLPTTTLGQLDSCVGAKCAVNTSTAKNILGLFSAPKEVIIPTFMIKSMPLLDHRAGLSEMLRLSITASMNAVNRYSELLPHIKNPQNLELSKYEKALQLSLSIKKSVVDFDEYETDVRRSMNYGHTFGHAIEKLVNFKIPHGLGVLLGMHIANKFSLSKDFMKIDIFNSLSEAIKSTIKESKGNFEFLSKVNPEDIIDQFKYDKKGDGESVPLVLIESPGNMIFYKYSFNSNREVLIDSISFSINKFIEWSKL